MSDLADTARSTRSPGQPPRVKAASKGAATGSKRRECEDQIQKYKQCRTTPDFRAWNAEFDVQSGSPIPSRLSRVLRTLADEAGFSVWRTRSGASHGDVIEIFPSEAIWSLGLSGLYAGRTSEEVRSYKTKGSFTVIGCAKEQAHRPLGRFREAVRGAGFNTPAAPRMDREHRRIRLPDCFCPGRETW